MPCVAGGGAGGRRRGRRKASAAAPSAIACMPRSTICVQLVDEILVGALGLGLGRLEPAEDFLDAVDGGQDQRHRVGGDRHAVAEFAHQGLAGVGQRFKPRQPEEAASALDGVNQAEDVIEDLGVVRLLLEPHQLIVDGIQALAGLRQKFPQQIIHETGLRSQGARGRRAFWNLASFYAKRLILVE